MQKIDINTSFRPSTVFCGGGAFETGYGSVLAGRDLFVVTDSNVAEIYADLIAEKFANTPVFVMQAGEENKNQTTLFSILDAMTEHNCTRNTTVVAFGGGVVGDVSGFASSLYMRGTRLVQIPTTLLAQVDSSVGGKTAIDYKGYKNIVGSFYQPEYVLCDPLFLRTLPRREIACGLGEIIKTAALDREVFERLGASENFTDFSFLEEITALCVRFKGRIVERDERETSGLRKCLNLGHTTAHALELNYGGRSHGEYVLIGMLFEIKIAAERGICSPAYASALNSMISRVVKNIPDFENIGSAARSATLDKKNASKSAISLIVPEEIGRYCELTLSLREYTDYLEKFNGGAR